MFLRHSVWKLNTAGEWIKYLCVFGKCAPFRESTKNERRRNAHLAWNVRCRLSVFFSLFYARNGNAIKNHIFQRVHAETHHCHCVFSHATDNKPRYMNTNLLPYVYILRSCVCCELLCGWLNHAYSCAHLFYYFRTKAYAKRHKVEREHSVV